MAKPAAVKQTWTAAAVEALLRAKYAPPQFALLTEVRSSCGFGAARSADVVVMGIWPSTGHNLVGYEIKVARHDWLREMQQPEKAEAVGRFCDLWYVVAPPGVVQIHELPALWGLIEPAGAGLMVRRPATKRPDRRPVSATFLAALLRRVTEQSPSEQRLLEEFRRGQAAGAAAERESAQRADPEARARANLERLAARVAAFEKASGVEIDGYAREPALIGAAVRRVLDGDKAEASAKRALAEAAAALRRIADGLTWSAERTS